MASHIGDLSSRSEYSFLSTWFEALLALVPSALPKCLFILGIAIHSVIGGGGWPAHSHDLPGLDGNNSTRTIDLDPEPDAQLREPGAGQWVKRCLDLQNQVSKVRRDQDSLKAWHAGSVGCPARAQEQNSI